MTSSILENTSPSDHPYLFTGSTTASEDSPVGHVIPIETATGFRRGARVHGLFSLSALAAVLSACGGSGGQSNRPPTAVPDAGAATEDGPSITGNVGASDPDRDALTYSVTEQGAYGSLSVSGDGVWTYELDNGNPEVNALGPGSELADVATIVVNDGQVSIEARIQITITGVNDPPSVPAIEPTAQGLEVSENHLGGAELGHIMSVDPEGDGVNLTLSGPYSEYFELVDGVLRLKAGVAFDFEEVPGGEVLLTITATDDAGEPGSSNVEVRVRILDEPEPPTAFPDAGAATEDGQAVTGNVGASDQDSDALTYSVMEQGAYGVLSVSPEGVWTYEVDNGNPEVDALDTGAELVDVAIIAVSDGLHSIEARVEITITGVNDSPSIPIVESTAEGLEVSENDLAGAELGQVMSVDPEGDGVSLTLSGPYSEYFELVDGVLRLKAGVAFDFEEVPGAEVALTITATDDSEERNITAVEVRVAIIDEPEHPTVRFLTNLGVATVESGVALGEVRIFDPDAADANLGVEHIEVGDARFEVREQEGVFILVQREGVSIDPSELAEGRLEVALRVTDSHGLESVKETAAVWFVDGTLNVGELFEGSTEISDPFLGFGSGVVHLSLDDLEAGKTYKISLEADAHNGFLILDEQLVVAGVSKLIYTAQGSEGVFVPREDGIYQLQVNLSGPGGESGYSVLVEEYEYEDDFAPDTGTLGEVSIGQGVSGELEESGDEDWFRVELEAGKGYRIDLDSEFLSFPHQETIMIKGIFNDEGEVDPSTVPFGLIMSHDGSHIQYTPPKDGTYYVSVSGTGGSYTLSVVEEDYSDDFSAGLSTDGVVLVDSSVEGSLEEWSDQDWFAAELEAGKIYSIGVGDPASVSPRTDSGYFPYIGAIYNASGEIVHDERLFRSTEFEPTESGIYYFSIGHDMTADWISDVFPSFSDDEIRSGSYTLSVDDVSELRDAYRDAEVLELSYPGMSIEGAIDYPGEFDTFLFTAEITSEQRHYLIEVKGADGDGGTLGDPWVQVVISGEELSFSDVPSVEVEWNFDSGPGRDAVLDLRLSPHPITGDSTVEVAVLVRSEGNETGSYTLSVVPYEHLDDIERQNFGSIEVDSEAQGELEQLTDGHVYSISLAASKHYELVLEGDAFDVDPSERPVMYLIRNVDGVDFYQFRGINSVEYFSPEEDETFSVLVTGKGADTYSLSLNEVFDDYAGDISTSGMLEVGGSVEGLINDFDSDWFAVSVEKGKSYVFLLKGGELGGGTMDIESSEITIYDGEGNILLSKTHSHTPLLYEYFYGTFSYGFMDGLHRDSSMAYAEDWLALEFTPEESGTYYVGISNSGAFFDRSGTYTLSVQEGEKTSAEEDSEPATDVEDPQMENDSDPEPEDIEERASVEDDQQWMGLVDSWAELGM